MRVPEVFKNVEATRYTLQTQRELLLEEAHNFNTRLSYVLFDDARFSLVALLKSRAVTKSCEQGMQVAEPSLMLKG